MDKLTYVLSNAMAMIIVVAAMLIDYSILTTIIQCLLWVFILIAGAAIILAFREPTIFRHYYKNKSLPFGMYVDYTYDFTMFIILLLGGWTITAIFYLLLPTLTYILYTPNRRPL